MSQIWSVAGKSVVHESGLTISILDGSLAKPLDIEVRNSAELSAVKVATLVRQGLEFAATKPAQPFTAEMAQLDSSTTIITRSVRPKINAVADESRPKRKLLKLKR